MLTTFEREEKFSIFPSDWNIISFFSVVQNFAVYLGFEIWMKKYWEKKSSKILNLFFFDVGRRVVEGKFQFLFHYPTFQLHTHENLSLIFLPSDDGLTTSRTTMENFSSSRSSQRWYDNAELDRNGMEYGGEHIMNEITLEKLKHLYLLALIRL